MFHIKGRVDQSVEEAIIADNTSRVVIVDSAGGAVASALAIREHLAGLGVRSIRIENECSSAALFAIAGLGAPVMMSEEAECLAHKPSSLKERRHADASLDALRELWRHLEDAHGWKDFMRLSPVMIFSLVADPEVARLASLAYKQM